jgi:hypothetical protein
MSDGAYNTSAHVKMTRQRSTFTNNALSGTQLPMKTTQQYSDNVQISLKCTQEYRGLFEFDQCLLAHTDDDGCRQEIPAQIIENSQ